jgi:hypothetical protein
MINISTSKGEIKLKKIRKNAIKKMENILKQTKHIEYFTSENNYEGGTTKTEFTEKEIRFMLRDLEEGYSNMFEKADENEKENEFLIRYAFPCKIKIRI